VIGNAVKIVRIATGEEDDATPDDGGSDKRRALGPSSSRNINLQMRELLPMTVRGG
jgi:hypothetical protein